MPKVYPQLSSPDIGIIRFRGVGVGNLWFPYFRAYVYASQSGAEFVEPPWFQIKFNQLKYVGTSRSRLYLNLFRSETRGVADLFKRMQVILSPHKVYEGEWLLAGRPALRLPETLMVSGMRDYFTPLISHRHQIIGKFARMQQCKHVLMSNTFQAKNYISVHIRLGDFKRNGTAGEHNVALGFHEIGIVLKALVATAALPIYLVTDANDCELANIMVEGIILFRAKTVLEEFNILRCATILIASGSTFSMWAAFLGRAAVLRPYGMFWALERCPDIWQREWRDRGSFIAGLTDALSYAKQLGLSTGK